MKKILASLFVLGFVQGCTHPLEIVGDGDIVDLNGTKYGCTLEQYQAGDKAACKKNLVIGAYDVNYSGQPKEGNTFIRWDGTCGPKSEFPNCAHKVSKELVKEFSFRKVPATIAVFCPSEGLFSEDFEAMTPGQGYPPNDLADSGWVVFGAEYALNPYTNEGIAPSNSYGPFPAADGDPGTMQAIAVNEGGRRHGVQHLNKYSDYNNASQTTKFIEGITLQQKTVQEGDVGSWTLSFEAKRKSPEEFGIGGQSSAYAFVKTLDSSEFFQKGYADIDMTQVGKVEKWARYSVTLNITEEMVGDLLQFGFSATAFNYEPSGIYYDNIFFGKCDALAVPQ